MVTPGDAWSAIADLMAESSRGTSLLDMPTVDGFARASASPNDATALGAGDCADIPHGARVRASTTRRAKRAKRFIEAGLVRRDTNVGSGHTRWTAVFRLKVNGYKVPHRITHRGVIGVRVEFHRFLAAARKR